jgi:hypothetical protein
MKRFERFFIAVCLFHFAEHIAQIYQLYALNWRLHEAGGILGVVFPWLLHSETLHYGFALFMLGGFWILRNECRGKARFWWMVAFWVQVWHHFEHALLIGQVALQRNFFDAPQPISVIQFTGFFVGDAASGFGGILSMSHFGLCDCPGAAPGTYHEWSPMLFLVRRPEVHLLYNVLVMVPMAIAFFTNRHICARERACATRNCSVEERLAEA